MNKKNIKIISTSDCIFLALNSHFIHDILHKKDITTSYLKNELLFILLMGMLADLTFFNGGGFIYYHRCTTKKFLNALAEKEE